MSDTQANLLDTSAGPFPLHDYRFRSGRSSTPGAVLTGVDETHAIVLKTNRLPYGVSLWPSAIAQAHEIATRAETSPRRSVLVLGAGTGLPGIAAASICGGASNRTSRPSGGSCPRPPSGPWACGCWRRMAVAFPTRSGTWAGRGVLSGFSSRWHRLRRPSSDRRAVDWRSERRSPQPPPRTIAPDRPHSPAPLRHGLVAPCGSSPSITFATSAFSVGE